MKRRSGRRSTPKRTRKPARGRMSIGGAITGLMVALSSSFLFAVLTGVVLQDRGHNLHKVVRGETDWASSGAGTAFAVALFLSFLWGGYTAGRMGAGSGAANGLLVPLLGLLAAAGLIGLRLGVQGADSYDFPFGVGNLPLDGNFTPLGFGIVGACLAAIVAGGMWGGVIGARWHLRKDESRYAERSSPEEDTFSDLGRREGS